MYSHWVRDHLSGHYQRICARRGNTLQLTGILRAVAPSRTARTSRGQGHPEIPASGIAGWLGERLTRQVNIGRSIQE
jgi:hypothetical protein